MTLEASFSTSNGTLGRGLDSDFDFDDDEGEDHRLSAIPNGSVFLAS